MATLSEVLHYACKLTILFLPWACSETYCYSLPQKTNHVSVFSPCCAQFGLSGLDCSVFLKLYSVVLNHGTSTISKCDNRPALTYLPMIFTMQTEKMQSVFFHSPYLYPDNLKIVQQSGSLHFLLRQFYHSECSPDTVMK